MTEIINIYTYKYEGERVLLQYIFRVVKYIASYNTSNWIFTKVENILYFAMIFIINNYYYFSHTFNNNKKKQN